MKTLMCLCLPAVLGVASLFSVAPAAQAVEAPTTQATHVAGAILDGPFYSHAGALEDAIYRANEGFDCQVYFDDGFWWVLCD